MEIMYDMEISTNKTLNKCKHCGCSPVVMMRPLMYWVQCNCCGYSMRYFLNEDSAMTAWNEANKPPTDKGGAE